MSSVGRESGLSLLEVLVAMTLVAMLGVIAQGGIQFGSAAWERAKDIGERTAETRAVRKFVERQIALARPDRLRDGSRTPPVAFDGRSDGVLLLGRLAAHLASPQDQQIALLVESDEAGRDALAVRWSAIPAEGPGAIPRNSNQEILLTGFRTARFDYFGDRGKGPQWHDTWSDTGTMPMLVRLRIDWPQEHGRRWPDLVVRLAE